MIYIYTYSDLVFGVGPQIWVDHWFERCSFVFMVVLHERCLRFTVLSKPCTESNTRQDVQNFKLKTHFGISDHIYSKLCGEFNFWKGYRQRKQDRKKLINQSR